MVRVDSYWNPSRGKWYHTGDTTLSTDCKSGITRVIPPVEFVQSQIQMIMCPCYTSFFARLLSRLDFMFGFSYTNYADIPHLFVLHFMRYICVCQCRSQNIKQYFRIYKEVPDDIW